MRDILVTLAVFSLLPFCVARPWIGILAWSWISYMNPHRLAWGFAFDFPFAMLVAAATLLGILFAGDKRKPMPRSATLWVWLAFVFWMNVSTWFAINSDAAWAEWQRSMKIQLFALLTVWLIQTRERINALVWIIVLSLGFFGIKGGIFAALTGGAYRVWGPSGSFIADNNTLALALIVVLPLMRYLQLTVSSRLGRFGLYGMMALTALSILASQSRGALVAGVAMCGLLIAKSRQRWRVGAVAIAAAVSLLAVMPQSWYDRMATITEYRQDESSIGRINAWGFAINLAQERPLVGGGFQSFTPELFLRLAPNPTDFHDAHSIYFEVLAEQGYVGLILFLMLLYLSYRSARGLIRQCLPDPGRRWIADLAAMLQVALVGYSIGGLFLGLAYFDLPYHIIGLILILRTQAEEPSAASADASPEAKALVASRPKWRFAERSGLRGSRLSTGKR